MNWGAISFKKLNDILESGCDILELERDIFDLGCDILELGCNIVKSKVLVLLKTLTFKRDFLRFRGLWLVDDQGTMSSPSPARGIEGAYATLAVCSGIGGALALGAPSHPLWYLARWVVLLNGLSPGPLCTGRSLLGMLACCLRQHFFSCQHLPIHQNS